MGYSTYIKIGAYAKVTLPTTKVTETNTVMTCSNDKCKNHGKKMTEKFCPTCGSEIQNKTFTKTKNREFNLYDFYEELEEKKEKVNGHRLGVDYFFDINNELANGLKDNQVYLFYNSKNKHTIDLDSDDEGVIDLSDFNAQEKIDLFKTMHERMLGELAKAIGSENIEIRCGIIKYYM